MAAGSGTGRPPRRRLPEGEPGTAPVAYLPGAWRAPMADVGPPEHDGERDPDRSGERHDASTGRHDASTGERHDASTGERHDASTGERHDASTGRLDASTGDRAEPDRSRRRAENVSLSALARRGMSRHELETTLTARELEPAVVEAELDRLQSAGLIDDAALAETLVRTRHERKGLGRSALTAELRRRHIDQEHIDAALEQVDDDDEIARAGELAERRARQLSQLDRDTAERRLTGYLMRKGYPSSVVRAAVDAALPARHGGGVRFR